MKPLFLVVIMLILSIPLLSGCWNQRELTDLAFVVGMGVDKGKNEKYEVSLQVVIPGNVAAGQTGAGGQGVPVVVTHTSGNNINEAIRKATKSFSRRPYFAHTNLFVISEAVAKDGVLDLLDTLDRDPEFRTSAGVLIVKGTKALNLLSTLSVLDKIPVAKVVKNLEATEKLLGQNAKVTIDDLISAIVSDGREPAVSGIFLSGNPKGGRTMNYTQSTILKMQSVMNGIALFRKGKLVGWLDHYNARGAMWVMGKVNNTAVNVNLQGKKEAVSYIAMRNKTKVTAKVRNKKPIIHVFIETEGNLNELDVPIDLNHLEEFQKMERKISGQIKKETVAAIAIAQKNKSDIFGFGEKVHRKDPKLWKAYKKNWGDHFASLEVDVQVKTYIRREGIRTNPFWENIPR